MRAYKITVTLLLACALVVPATVSASPIGSGYTLDPAAGAANDTAGGRDYSSVNAITAPASEPGAVVGSSQADPDYASLNSITGAPASEPTLAAVTSSPDEGFDWGDAALGAGAAMALVAFGGAGFLTIRRHGGVSPARTAS